MNILFLLFMKINLVTITFFSSMQAVDNLFRKNEKEEKIQRLEKRRKKLSEMLLKEKKEFEVRCISNNDKLFVRN